MSRTRPTVLAAAMVATLLSACGRDDAPPPTPPAEAARDTATPGTTMQASPQPATQPGGAPAPLLDLRDDTPPAPLDEARTAQLMEAAGRQGIRPDASVAGLVEGSFTATGRQQQAALLLPGSEGDAPAETPPTLAVFEGGSLVGQTQLAGGAYTGIAGSGDFDGDGIDELLLRTDGEHLGQSFVSVDHVSIADGNPRVLQRFEQARLDTCDGDGEEREVLATVLVHQDGRLAAQRFRAECGADGADAFAPIDDPDQGVLPPAAGQQT
ncbi:hypothetical protein [Coralloluteibacterium thermophilus]|uniref:VCBS repeat-containing protein n=1 Tax=Coralloluteibacterium thermophilum TaxID=2707049 RepID=A0ABV9NLR4_9GAMM